MLHLIYKRDVPCRPVLSMIGSGQHELTEFLAALLRVLELYSTDCINNFFYFGKMV